MEQALQHPYVSQFRCSDEEIVCDKVITITINDNKKFDIAKYRNALYEDIAKRKREQRKKLQQKYYAEMKQRNQLKEKQMNH